MEAPIKTRYDKAGPQVAEALRRGVSMDAVFDRTKIDRWFLAAAILRPTMSPPPRRPWSWP